MTDKKIMKMLADAVEIGLSFLPDSSYYEEPDEIDVISWVWDECNDEQQEKVKGVRNEMNKAHLAYSKYIKEKL